MYNMGFRDLIMLDRAAEPFAEGYDIFTIKSLDAAGSLNPVHRPR